MRAGPADSRIIKANKMKEMFFPAAAQKNFDCFDILHYKRCIKTCLNVVLSP